MSRPPDKPIDRDPEDNTDPTVTAPARTDGRSDGLEEKKPIRIFRAGENAGGDTRSTAASTRT
jgi:hypothetical protein